MQLETSITTSHVVLTASAFVLSYFIATVFIYPLLSQDAKWWKSQSWVGLRDQWFAQVRAGFATIKDTRSFVEEGYKKVRHTMISALHELRHVAQYSKQNKLFVMPQFASQPVVIIPPEKIHDFLNLPDEQVDAFFSMGETITSKYTVGHEVSRGVHIDVVRRQLTRRLPLLTNDVYDELVVAMKANWTDSADKWTTVKAYPTTMKIVSRAANRVFCGAELCQNEYFIEHCRLYTLAVFKAGGAMNLMPKSIHAFVAPFMTRDVKKHLKICGDICLPVIRERLAHIQNPQKDPGYKAPVGCGMIMLCKNANTRTD